MTPCAWVCSIEREQAVFIKIEPRFQQARDCTGKIPLRTNAGGYASIIRTIVGQQVSVASANAIWNRLEDAGMNHLDKIAHTSFDDLRALGLSRQKATYLHSLAETGIDFGTLEN